MNGQFVTQHQGLAKTRDSHFDATNVKSMSPPPMQLAASPDAKTAPPSTESTGQLMIQQLTDKGNLEFQYFQKLRQELEVLKQFPADGEASLKGIAEVGIVQTEKELEASKKRMEGLVKDIETLSNKSSSPEAINDIIARHSKVAVTSVSTFEDDGRMMISKDGLSKESKKTDTKADNGTVINNTDSRKDTYGIGNWKGTDTKTREVKVDDKKVSHTNVDSKTVDLLAGSYTSSKKSEVKVGDIASSEEESRSFGLNGYTATNTKVEGSEKDKKTEVKTSGAFRGEGKMGVKKGSAVTVEKDGAKSEVKKDANVGIVTGDEGVGMIGGLNASKDNLAKDGLKTGSRIGAKGKFVMNVEEVPGSNPKQYVISMTIGGDLSLGASVGREKMPDGADDMSARSNLDKASMSVGGQYDASRGMTIRKVMSAEDAKKYLESVTAAEDGKQISHHKELGIIAAVANNGGDLAEAFHAQTNVATTDNLWGLKSMENGESVTTFGSDKLGVDISAGAETGGFNFGIKLGESTKDGWAHTIGKEANGDTAVTVALDEENASSRGANLGIGVVSGEMGYGRKETNARSVKVVIPPNHPQHDEIVRKLKAAQSRDAVDSILQQYGLAPSKQVDSIGYSDTVNAGIKIAPFGINYGSGGAMKETVETAADGKQVRTFDASNDLGGSVSLGDYKYETGARESLNATVDPEGNVNGDISRTYSETSLSKSGDKLVENLKHNTLGVLTGSAKNAEKDVHVAGMILSNQDFEHIIATAQDPKAWTKLNNSTMLWDDWQRCREEIVAAGGDKAKATRALAKFMGKSGHGREAILERATRDFGSDQGGARYEFPDGLGDLKSKYVALAVGDPAEAVRVALGDGDLKTAMNKASSAIVQLNDLKFRMQQAQDQFNPGILGEMLSQISHRQITLARLVAKINGKKEGKELDDVEIEDATAKTRFTQLIEDCKTFKRQEMLSFQRVEETFEDNHVSRSEATDNMAETVKLNDLYIKWDKAITEMESLDAMYGFAASSKDWKKYRPSKKRFKNAVGGKNPFEYTLDQEETDLQHEVESDKFNQELFERSAASIEAKAHYEAKQAAAARKTERTAICAVLDPQIKAIRDQAYKGGGMCNGMNASGRAAEIKPEASKHWGQAFTKLALGAQAHDQYKMVSAHPDAVAKAVQNAADKTIAFFQEAIRLFTLGNQAQKGA